MNIEAKIGPGLHRIEAVAYHADPADRPSLSSSLARTLLDQSPLHAWTASPRLNPDWEPVDKKTFDIGRAAHREVLGKGAAYVVIPETMLSKNGSVSTNEAKAFVEEARAAGLTPIKQDEADGVRAMAEKLHDRLDQLKIHLDPDRSEMTVVAEIDAVLCRAMLDNLPEQDRLPIYDFKTCENANPHACMRAIMNYGYDVQAAHYIETVEAATGTERAFRLIFQEKTAPYEICVVEIHPESLRMAQKKTRRAREIWRQCVASDHWPGYPLGVQVIDLPEFFQERWLERESVEEEHKRRTGADILDAARRWQAPA